MSSSNNQNYRGVYTSLYPSLPPEAVEDVERAIWLKALGQTDSARAIFDNELKPFATVPLVVIERADLEHESGRWGRAWQILESALKQSRHKKADLNLPEFRLMKVTWAMLGIRHRGDLQSAAQEIERTRQWLGDVPVAEYTDIQARCVHRYVITYLLTKLSSKYDNPAAEQIPMSNKSDLGKELSPWNGLHDLRRSLVARGMVKEANAFFRVELNRTPPNDREPIVEEFLTTIMDLPTSQGRDLMESVVRLQWSNSYIQLHNASRAVEEFMKSQAALEKWCLENNITNKLAVLAFQNLICEQLEMVEDLKTKLSAAETFAAALEQIGSGKTDSCLETAADVALTLFRNTGKEEYLAKYFGFQARLERYDESYSEDLFDLVRHRISLIGVTYANMVDRQKSLEWISGFLKKYDYYSSPGELESLHRQRGVLLRSLGRFEEADEAEKRADEFLNMGPIMGKWLHMSFSNAVGPRDSQSEYDPENEEDVYFLTTWSSVRGDTNKMCETIVDLLLDWSFEDVVKGHLTSQEFHNIMGESAPQFRGQDGTSAQGHLKSLKDQNRESLASILFPTDAESEMAHRPRFESITNWLRNPPKGQRNKRLFCLLMLRDSRQYIFSDTRLWDLRINELKALLELYDGLPPTFMQVIPSQKSSWLCALALTYDAQTEGAQSFLDFPAHEILRKAESYNEMAIEELRKVYQPNQLALQQRFGAQLCIKKIRQLEQQSERLSGGDVPLLQTDPAATTEHVPADPAVLRQKIAALRSLGLSKIKEAEQINTDSELHESWLDGLVGLDHRKRMAQFQMSFYTIHTAINLLLEQHDQEDASKSTVTEIWTWVQKFKARSLARTIGTRSSIPESLLSPILASPVARPMYEEMLDLKKQIDEAELSNRFDLRKRSDVLQRKMRADPLLRRLIDLREGTPLDETDIAAIQAEAGRPIVLVDWYFLPGYPDGAEDRLLLFTARAESDFAPTMDILNVKIEAVNAWIDEYLHCLAPKLHRPETRFIFDRALGGLIAPLLHRTKEGEVLVLCPTLTLTWLPLHAISLQIPLPGQNDFQRIPLIHRNPVVYSHSHSLLRSCFSAGEQSRHRPEPIEPIFLSGIAEAEWHAGRTSIRDLARLFRTEPMIDDSSTKKQFLDSATKSRLLHLHTHCSWKFSDPLDHHVSFPGLGGSSNPELKLTAREVFEINLRPGTHFNMIACQGGVTEVKPGDEVLGLVPALLYSGATSVISTLWSIADRDGARFSKFFFQSFMEQCMEQAEGQVHTEDQGPIDTVEKVHEALSDGTEDDQVRFVDLAEALQDAVISMDRDGIQPLYHWAGFILHGFWQFPLSKLVSYRQEFSG